MPASPFSFPPTQRKLSPLSSIAIMVCVFPKIEIRPAGTIDAHQDMINLERLDRLRNLLPQVIEQQERAMSLADCGDPGAHDWYEHQTAYRQRIEQLIGVLENPDVPVGSKIRLANSTANPHLHRVLKQVALQSAFDADVFGRTG